MVKKEEFVFDSRDGQSKIHAVRWIPEGKVIGILQIVHGMAEYIERYEEMAHFSQKRESWLQERIILDMERVWTKRKPMVISVNRIRRR